MVRYLDKAGNQIEKLRRELHNIARESRPVTFVEEIRISNFRCFPAANNKNDAFKISFNTPKGNKPGSGLTVLSGENNSGKSTVLRAIGLFSQSDENLESMLARHELHASCVDDPEKGIEIYLNTSRGGFYLKTTNCGEKLEWECDSKILKETFECQKIDNLTNTDLFLNTPPDDAIANRVIHGSSFFAPKCSCAERIFGSKIRQGNRRDGESYPIEWMPCGRSIPARQTGSGDRQFRHVMNTIKNNDETSAKTDACHLFLLDEPEIHLHPKAVYEFVDLLWEASAKVQIILASHSPVLIEAVYNKAKCAYDEAEKKAMVKKTDSLLPIGLVFPTSNSSASLTRDPEPKYGKKPEDYFRILSKDTEADIIRSQSAKPFLLNPVSADEINYCAFDYPTAFYFIQLSGKLKEQLQVRQKNERISEDDIVRKDLKEITKKRKTLGKCVPWKGKYPGETEEEDTAIFIRHFCATLKHPQFKKIKYSPNDLLPELIEALRALIEYNNDIGNNRHLS